MSSDRDLTKGLGWTFNGVSFKWSGYAGFRGPKTPQAYVQLYVSGLSVIGHYSFCKAPLRDASPLEVLAAATATAGLDDVTSGADLRGTRSEYFS